jgi:hypothetical protein
MANKIDTAFIRTPLVLAGTLIDGAGDEIQRIIERVAEPIGSEVTRTLKNFPELEKSKKKHCGEGDSILEDSFIYQNRQLEVLTRMQKLVDELRADAEAIRTKERNLRELAEAFNGE